MKSQLIRRVVDCNSSISFQNYCDHNFLKVWHYHAELELNLIVESTGTAFVGDSVERFEPGDIVLVGKNVPHLWLNDEYFFDSNSTLKSRAYIIHFFDNFCGGFFDIPEMSDIRDVMERAKLGIKFTGKGNNPVIKKMTGMVKGTPYERIMLFIDVLKMLSTRKDYKILCNSGYMDSFVGMHKDRLLSVYEYIMTNFKEEISLEEAARLAYMNSSSFSRYFKSVHKKSFTRFVNEVRIGHSCKLLVKDKHIASACYESGFNNISNFNRQFKAIKNMTPSIYVKKVSIE